MGNSIKELGDNFKYANKEFANSGELFGESGYLNNVIRGKQKPTYDIDKIVPISERSDDFLQKQISILDELEKSGDEKALKRFYDTSLNDYQKYIAEYGKATQNEKRTIEGLRKYQNDYISSLERQNKEAAKSSIGSRISSGISSIGKSALALAGNIALMYAVSKGIELAARAWDNYSHRQEKAIEKGEQTLASHKHSLENYNDTAKTIDAVGERFEELRKGVSSTGENIGLTTSEFEEYQSIVSQISSSMPELIDGYDSLGNPIISTITNVEQLTSALKEQQRVIAQENIGNAKDYAEAFNAVMNQSPTDFTQESGLLQQRKILDEIITDINNGQNIAEKYFSTDEVTNFAAGIASPISSLLRTPGDIVSGLFEHNGIELPDKVGSAVSRVWQSSPAGGGNLLNAFNSSVALAKSIMDGKSITESVGDAAKAFASSTDVMSNSVEQNISDLLTLQDIAKEAGVNDDVLSKIQSGKQLDSGTEQYVRDKIMAYSKRVDQEMNSQFNNTKPLLESMLVGDGTNGYYDNLKDTTKNAISQIVNGMDVGDALESGLIGEDGNLDTDSFKSWANGLAQSINKSGAEDALKKIFDLDTKKGSMSLSEYENAFNRLAGSVTTKVPELTKGVLKSATGFNEYSNDLMKYQKDLQDAGMKFADITSLSNDDLELVWKFSLEDNFSPIWGDIKAKLAQSKREAKQFNDLYGSEAYDEWSEAQGTENQGSKYDAMYSGLAAAKDAFDKGLTGTDDFKKYAGLISPTGSENAVNFAENYAKAARYLTEDKTGVNNFLSDLSNRTNAAGEALASFDKTTGKWAFNISDMALAADKMGISTEFMMANFNKAKEYGIDNNFVASQEEGAERIKTLATDLAKAEGELAQMLTPGRYDTTHGKTKGNQTAIDAKIQEINDYKEAIRGTKEYMSDMNDTWAQDQLSERNAAKSAVNTLADEWNKIKHDKSLNADDREYLSSGIEDQINALANEYDLELTGDMHVNGASSIEELNAVKSEAMAAQSALNEATGTDYQFNFDSTDVEDLSSQIENANQQLATFRDENGNLVDSEQSSQAQTVLEGLLRQREYVDSMNNSPIMRAESTEPAVKAMQDFISAKDEYDTKMQMNTQGANYNLDEFQASTQAAADNLQNIIQQTPELASIGEKLDFSNTDSLEASLRNLSEEDLVKLKATLDLSEAESNAQDFKGSIQQETVEMKVGVMTEIASGDIGSTLGSLTEGQTANIDVQVNGAEQVEQLDNSLSQAQEGSNVNVTCTVSNKEDLESVTALQEKYGDSGVNIQIEYDSSGEENSVDLTGKITSIEGAEGQELTIDAKANITSVEGAEGQELVVDAKARITGIEQTESGNGNKLEVTPTMSGAIDPQLTQLTNEAPIQKKVEVSADKHGITFLGELTAEDFQKTITVNEEKGTEVTTEEAEPVIQTVNQELGTEVTTEEPAPVSQKVNQELGTEVTSEDPPPVTQEVQQQVTQSAEAEEPAPVTQEVLQKVTTDSTPDIPPVTATGTIEWDDSEPPTPDNVTAEGTVNWINGNPPTPPAGLTTEGTINWVSGDVPPPGAQSASVNYTLGDQEEPTPKSTEVNYTLGSQAPPTPRTTTVNYSLGSQAPPAPMTATVNYINGGGHSAGTVSNNSFNAMTSAHAGGTVNKTPKLKSSRFNNGYLGHAYVNPKDNGLKHDEIALVNEVGGEAIVRDGKVMIMNNGYPSLTSLKSGDIIFNHKQTAELMKKGYISNSHGKLHGSLPARATGTVNTGIPAHAEGSKSKWEKSYDFIQRRIESLEYQYKAHQDSSELAESLTKKNRYLDKALKDNKKLIASNEKGDRYYYEKAMSVGLSKELRDKVRTGDIRMEDYDEGTKQQIEDYSKMLDLSRQCREAVRDLKKEQKELANQKLENVLDYYDSKLGVLKGQQGYEAAKQKLNVATGHGGNRMVKERLNRQLKNQNQQTKLYEQQMAKYKETLKTVGKTIGKNSKEYRDALAQYNELKEAWVESKVAAQEYKNEIRDINYQWKQNKVDKYKRGSDRLVGVREYYDTAKNISASKRGGIIAQQIKNNSNQIIEKKALADSYRKEQATLHFNDERYQELADLIANLDTEIINLGTDTIKLQDDIREIRWEGFENGMTDINNRLQEFADIRSMISSDSMVYAEDGSLTDFGYANILLTADAMELNNQKIADYREAIEKLKEEEQNGVISKEKYNELVNQYQKEIRDAASANKDYKQSLIDMYETQINYENDALQDNITKRKNALKAKKEYYDYDKRIKKQNKDINSLKAQISALQGATNAADIAKRLRLEEELADLMDEKDETTRDHAYDLQIDGYEKLADAADESLKKTENALATSTQAQQQCVDNMLNKMTSSYSTAYGKVDEIVKSSGIAVSTSFQETIKNFDGLTEVGNITVDKFVQSINTKVIAGLNDLAQKIVNGTTSGNDTNTEASGDGLVHVQSVKLSKTSITIIEGESITLTAEVLPKNANVRTLDWSTNSDNIKISTPKGATNSLSKVITGVKTNGRGDACIVTVTTRDVVHKTATCKVRVTTKTASLLNQLKGKSNAGTSAVNKVLREFGYGQASQASMVQFASDLGVKDVTAKNVMNADKQKAIAEKLRARFEKDEKRAVVKSIIDSLPDENRSKEAISKLSQLNQYISSSTGKRLTQTGALQLAEAMRLVVPGDYDSWSTGDKNFVLDEFKKLGFAKGGKISSGHYLPSKLLNEVPGNNGDDGWITVQREEVVLNRNETRQLKMQSAIMSDILSNISNGYNGLENPSYDATQRNAIPTDIIRNAGNISFNYGNMIDLDIANVDKDVMPDLDRLLGKCIKQTKEELLKEFRKMGYR